MRRCRERVGRWRASIGCDGRQRQRAHVPVPVGARTCRHAVRPGLVEQSDPAWPTLAMPLARVESMRFLKFSSSDRGCAATDLMLVAAEFLLVSLSSHTRTEILPHLAALERLADPSDGQRGLYDHLRGGPRKLSRIPPAIALRAEWPWLSGPEVITAGQARPWPRQRPAHTRQKCRWRRWCPRHRGCRTGAPWSRTCPRC